MTRSKTRKKSPAWQAEDPAAASARAHLASLLDQFCSAGDRLISDHTAIANLHRLRLHGKHMRYTLEVFRPIYGRRMDEMLDTMKQTQNRLGDISDTTATIAWLKRQGIHKAPESVQLEMYLESSGERLAAHFAEFWRDHWGLPAFRQRWLTYLRRYAGQGPPAPRAAPAKPDVPDDGIHAVPEA